MSLLPQLALADSQRLFEDWSLPAQLLEVRQQFNPETGRVEEGTFRADIRVVAGSTQIRARPTAPADAPLEQTLFLALTDELPARHPLNSSQLQIGSQTFVIRHIENSALTGVVALVCDAEQDLSSTPESLKLGEAG